MGPLRSFINPLLIQLIPYKSIINPINLLLTPIISLSLLLSNVHFKNGREGSIDEYKIQII